MRQQEVIDGGNTALEPVEWAAEVRERALARLGRRAPRSPRTVWFGALALLGALHALLLWRWYASRFPPPRSEATVVQVRLIDESAPPPQAKPIRVPRTKGMTASMLPAPPFVQNAVVAPSAPASAQSVLFNRDGSVRLPLAPHFESPLGAGLVRGRELLARGHNIIRCRRSKFDDSPTPEEAANQAGRNARMAQLVMGNPLDPLGDVGAAQDVDSARELAAASRAIEQQACDY